MKKTLRIIKISKLYGIIQQFSNEYLGIYAPQCTILFLDKNKKHQGSIYLKDEIEINT
jgi:hypothetical protein